MVVTYFDKHIKCPYFRECNPNSKQITCEGVDGVSSTRMNFRNYHKMKEYIFNRCAKDYCLCVLCRGLNEFYEEIDND